MKEFYVGQDSDTLRCTEPAHFLIEKVSAQGAHHIVLPSERGTKNRLIASVSH